MTLRCKKLPGLHRLEGTKLRAAIRDINSPRNTDDELTVNLRDTKAFGWMYSVYVYVRRVRGKFIIDMAFLYRT